MTTQGEKIQRLLFSALGPGVANLLEDPAVSEVRLNSDGKIWANRLGEGKKLTNITVSTEKARQAIFTVAYSVNSICNEDVPRISAELPGSGERFQGLLPPLVAAPVIVIRKKAVKIFTLEEMVAQGVITSMAREVLSDAVKARRNIIVVGGTDSGKTTFTNALLDVISGSNDRIVIIEDTPELQCRGNDVEYLRTRDGIATLRDLVRDTMRLSPDRIVIGEVRGAEALDLLKAWNTGHSGGVSTLHASSAARGLGRLEQLVQEAGVSYSKGLISEAVEIVVYMEKVGTRRVVQEILRLDGLQGGEYKLSTLA